MALVFSGCGAIVDRSYHSSEAMDAITALSAQVKTSRGRAWISAHTPQQKISFPAVIVVDRTNPRIPLMRIEAMDPLGATHALLILDQHAQLTWVDYDNQKIYRVRENWYGVPLARLPELLLGFMTPPADGKVGAVENSKTGLGDPARIGDSADDGFEVTAAGNVFRYAMEWIDPGPRLVVRGIEGAIRPHALGQAQGSDVRERYVVDYSHFLDKDDFYLPAEVKVRGFGATTKSELPEEHPVIELNVAWRERRWNEVIPMQVFALPNGPLDTFERVE